MHNNIYSIRIDQVLNEMTIVYYHIFVALDGLDIRSGTGFLDIKEEQDTQSMWYWFIFMNLVFDLLDWLFKTPDFILYDPI